MQAGKMFNQIDILVHIGTQDGYGAPVDTWRTIATGVWCEMITNSGKEFFAAQKINAETTTVFKLRYRAGIKADMHIKLGNRLFDILFINDVDNLHKELQLLTRELV